MAVSWGGPAVKRERAAQQAAPSTTAVADENASPRVASNLRAWAIRIAGTLLFIGLIVWLDLQGALPLEQVFSTLAGANLWLVALSIGLYIFFLVVKAQRWRLVSGDMLMPLKWGDAWRIYAIGLAAGTFTPGQAGDAIKAWFLQRIGYPLGRALGGSVLDRLFDVAALALLGLVGIAVYGQRFAGQVPALAVIAFACLVVVAFFAWPRTRVWLVGLVARRFAKLGVGSDDGRRTTDDGRQTSEWSLERNTLLNSALLTVASFTISIFRVWLLAAALGVWLGPLEVTGFVGLTTAAALVPVTVGGIGTRDVVAALAFTQLGRPGAEGVAVSALILVLNLAQAVIGWVVWLRYRPEVGSR
jgi:uncharacterized membrane protein YbhN (UPF0104 family)